MICYRKTELGSKVAKQIMFRNDCNGGKENLIEINSTLNITWGSGDLWSRNSGGLGEGFNEWKITKKEYGVRVG
jgi:hypothetical protein